MKNEIQIFVRDECPICLEETCLLCMIKLKCGHCICDNCLQEIQRTSGSNCAFSCPICRRIQYKFPSCCFFVHEISFYAPTILILSVWLTTMILILHIGLK